MSSSIMLMSLWAPARGRGREERRGVGGSGGRGEIGGEEGRPCSSV